MSGEGLIAEARAVHASVGHARLKELMHRGTEFLGCDVAIMGGGAVTSARAAGLVDEVILHQVPILLGAGRSFFQELPEHVELRLLEAIPAPGVTHLHYEVVR